MMLRVFTLFSLMFSMSLSLASASETPDREGEYRHKLFDHRKMAGSVPTPTLNQVLSINNEEEPMDLGEDEPDSNPNPNPNSIELLQERDVRAMNEVPDELLPLIQEYEVDDYMKFLKNPQLRLGDFDKDVSILYTSAWLRHR